MTSPPRRRRRWLLAGALAACVLLLAGLGTGIALAAARGWDAASPQPRTMRHLAVNGNFVNGAFTPGRFGFNLADVSTRQQLDAAPAGVRGLIWLDGCSGATPAFVSAASAFAGDARLFGFYLADDASVSNCPPANLAAASDWIHGHLGGARTFIVLEDLCASHSPCYRGAGGVALTPANTHVDLFGLDAYPCRTDLAACDDSIITKAVRAAEAAGVPRSALVPLYQAFGGNRAWADDSGGYYAVPTPTQERALMASWAELLPDPVFDYAYSWGVQRGDVALATSGGALQQVFAEHNRG